MYWVVPSLWGITFVRTAFFEIYFILIDFFPHCGSSEVIAGAFERIEFHFGSWSIHVKLIAKLNTGKQNALNIWCKQNHLIKCHKFQLNNISKFHLFIRLILTRRPYFCLSSIWKTKWFWLLQACGQMS